MNQEQSRRITVLGLVGLACVLRVAFVLAYPQPPITGDAAAYDAEAQTLAFGHTEDGRTFPFSKGPLYAVMLAGVYRVAGHQPAAARVAQAVIGALSVWLVYALAHTIFGHRVATVAAGLAAGYPAFIVYTGWLLTEAVSGCLLLVFILLLVRALNRSSVMWWVSAGIVGGLLGLLREEFLGIVVGAVVVLWVLRVAWQRVALVLLATILTVLPWTVRNTLVFHHVVLVSTGGGQLVWLSTVPFTGGEWNEHAPHYQQVYRPLVQGLSAVEADRRLAREGLHNIVQRPWEYLRLCLLRVPRLWLSGHSNMMVHLENSSWNYWVRGQYGQALVKIALLLLNLGVVLLGVLGGYLAFSAGAVDVRQASVLTVPIAVKTMIHTLLFAVARYQIPILPFLMIFAAYACWRVHRVTRALVPG